MKIEILKLVAEGRISPEQANQFLTVHSSYRKAGNRTFNHNMRVTHVFGEEAKDYRTGYARPAIWSLLEHYFPVKKRKG